MARRKEKDAPLVICRIELTPEAKEHIDSISETRGMTQTAMLSRLVEWFAVQPPIVQGLVMGHYPDDVRNDAMAVLVEHLAKHMNASVTG